MSASQEFVSYIRDQLTSLGPLSERMFFGGHAFKLRGDQFAMVMGYTLYLRVSTATRPEFERRGSTPFSFATKKGRVQVRKFYSVPEEVLEDAALLTEWARKAVHEGPDA